MISQKYNVPDISPKFSVAKRSYKPSTLILVLARRIDYPFLLIFLFGALLRFHAIGSKTVWLDEAFSIWVAHHSLASIGSWLVRIDQHPPLYYVLLHGWMAIFGDLQGPVRWLSALCSTLAMPFFYATGKRLFDRPTALVAALILAISPFQVQYAQETRMYALLTLGVAAALFSLAHLLSPRQPSYGACGRRWWVGLAVAEAIVMWTHNTATVIFPLALNFAILATVFWMRKRRMLSSMTALNCKGFLRRWLIWQGVAFVLWLPWAIPFYIQAAGVYKRFWVLPPTLQTIGAAFQTFNFAFAPTWLPVLVVWNVLYGALAVVSVVVTPHYRDRVLIVLALFLMPPVLELLVSLRRPIFLDRTLIWVTLPYYLLIATGIRHIGDLGRHIAPGALVGFPTGRAGATRLQQQTTRTVQAILIGGICVLCGFSLNSYYVTYQKEEWDRAAAYIARHAATTDLILFNATWVQIPFDYYFRHYHMDVPIHGLPVDLFDRGEVDPR